MYTETNNETASEQATCPYCDGAGYVETGGRRFLCRCQSVEKKAIRRKYSGLPPFEKRPLKAVTKGFIDGYEQIKRSRKNWILYMGRSGSGKSTQAFLIVDALLERPQSIFAKVFSYPELARELSAKRYDAGQFEETMERVLAPELIVLDDWLDVIPKPESFEENVALTLIKRRYTQRKPMVVTTELTPDGFQRALPRHGEAFFGRFFEMCDGRISVAGADSKNYRLATN